MTHLEDAVLSSYLDGELAPAEAASARDHLKTCPECEARRARLAGASAAFRRSGAEPMPAGLAARSKAGAAVRRRGVTWTLAGVVASMVLLLVGGVVVKWFMPSLFNNIQQMITGAAAQMGNGGR